MRPEYDLIEGFKYPYDGMLKARDEAERAALGVLACLLRQTGINHELNAVDYESRHHVVSELAAIIREAHKDVRNKQREEDAQLAFEVLLHGHGKSQKEKVRDAILEGRKP